MTKKLKITHDRVKASWRMRVLLALIASHFSLLTSSAQNYTIEGEVEPVVHVGENFHLRYHVNTLDVRNFSQTSVPDAFQVLYGPSQSVNISSSTINGRSTSSEELTMTYVLSATKTGTFTIPPATATVGGRQLKSNALTVNVIAAEERVAAPQASANNFFILVTASKKHVNFGEPFLLTYKVCWHPDLPIPSVDDMKLDLQDVYMLPYNDTQRKSLKAENIGGHTMKTIDWKQYVVYPQKTGTLHIPSITVQGYLTDVIRDPFDPFMNMTREIPRQLTTQPLDITVTDLPQRPANYSGGVGRFSISGKLEPTTVKENTPVTLTLTISGHGNLKMLRQPEIAFPQSFDTYDAKQSENFTLTADGLDGTLTFEYIAVPQKRGNYVIPAASLTYYDTDARDYRTVQTEPFALEVLKGDGTASSMQDFTGRADDGTGDIHAIRTGKENTAKAGSFFGTTAYFILMAAFILLFIIIFIVLRMRMSSQADAVQSRRKRANKVAVSKLRKAAKLMRAGKAAEFYDETLRALWGYVGDKLNIPVSQLSRENISQRLDERGVGQEVTDSFIAAIDECEFVRYAPGDPQGNMSRVYEKSITAIEQIESVKQNKKKMKPLAVLFLPLAMSLCFIAAHAESPSKVRADEAFSQEQYDEAISIYEQLLSQKGPSADVYYNLGNAYFRIDSLSAAILSWERALRMQPSDDDARFNLQLARAKTIDKIAPEREMFFVTWYRSLVQACSVDLWAVIGLASLAVALMLALVWFFAFSERLRRISFTAAVLLLVLFLLSNLFAWQQQRALQRHDEAIVMVQSLQVKNTPTASGSDEFTIHAGTKVTITDGTMSEWKQIILPDGREGWVRAKEIEVI